MVARPAAAVGALSHHGAGHNGQSCAAVHGRPQAANPFRRVRLPFKMPPNSLFAVLLRSPWWVSLLIAAVLGLVAAALLPEAFRVVGALSGFPFIVIAAMAAQRQWRLPSAARVQQTQAAVSSLGWPAFQALLEDAFRRSGFDVLPAGGGDAVDLVLQRGGRRTLVSARRWKSARLGVEPLRALQAARVAPARTRRPTHASMASRCGRRLIWRWPCAACPCRAARLPNRRGSGGQPRVPGRGRGSGASYPCGA